MRRTHGMTNQWDQLKSYRHLTGPGIFWFYPGKIGGLDAQQICDDTEKPFCWNQSKLLGEDKECDYDKHRCLHLAWRDGSNMFAYSCPGWLRNPINGLRCNNPGSTMGPNGLPATGKDVHVVAIKCRVNFYLIYTYFLVYNGFFKGNCGKLSL